MDLKNYYRKIRDVEARLSEDHVVVVSRATGNGGREGVLTEVPRNLAARLVVEGAAEVATPEEATAFREGIRARHAEEEAKRAAARIQVNVISEADARLLAPDRTADRKRKA